MGNDGGSIPTRRELVKEAARNLNTTEVKEKQKEVLAHRWSMCPLSHKPLARPVVSDCAGDLYNKDAVLQYLLPADASSLDKDECDKFVQGRIMALKDIVEVLFEVEAEKKPRTEKWICPVTSKALGPNVKAVYLVPCGHAFSNEAIKEMKTDQCLQCGHTYETRDVIPILPVSEIEQDGLKTRMEVLSASGLTHSLKRASGSGKKRKANGTIKTEALATQEIKYDPKYTNSTAESPEVRPAIPQSGNLLPKVAKGIKNTATASLTAKVLEEEEARKKRRTITGENENLRSLFSKGTSQQQRNGDFMTRGFSIPTNARHQ